MTGRMRLIALLLLLCTPFGAACSKSQPPPAGPGDVTMLASNFIDLLAKGDFTKAADLFDPTMKQQLPVARLSEIWRMLSSQAGPFKERTGIRTEVASNHTLVFVTCKFDRDTIDVRVVFNSSRQIAGLFFHSTYKPPGYADPQRFREEDVTIGSGEWALPGTLTLPSGKGPFAAVVLVHGSGPNDRDETIGPNKPFRDIAWGLATKGIAVLRYEKRTREHRSKMATGRFTVNEETVDDALLGVSLLRQRPEIDSNRLFVLGHSLGGMLLPRIGSLDKQIAGLIVLAGSTRPFEDMILEQYEYIFGLDGSISAEEEKQLASLREQVSKVKDPGLAPDAHVLGAPGSYWIDLRGYNPPAVAATLASPMLVLQGERDYQVTMKDFENWKTSLAAKKDVTFKSYPSLNHLFISGQGKITPAEYEVAGNVDKEVIEDIARWVLGY